MHRSFRMHRDESGIAMVMAMFVVLAVVLLSTAILDMSIHNTGQAAYDRKRVTSVAAAESGIDKAWNRLEFSAPEELPCGTPDIGTLQTAPGPASYSVVYTYFDATGTTLGACPSQTNVPASVLVTSTGTTNNGVPRTMQAYMTLVANTGGFDAAIISVQGMSTNNSFTINGTSSNDGDVYVLNGNLSLSNAPVIHGSAYVPNGSATMSNSSRIVGDLWTNNSISMSNSSTVVGDATSSTSSIGGSNAASIGGDARAGTTIGTPPAVGGTRYPNSPQGPPPTQAFPKLCQVAISGVCPALSWPGYNIITYTGASACSSALTYLTTGTITGDTVVWINQVCTLSFTNLKNINFTGNLAVVTQGAISMSNSTNWNGQAGKNLFLIVNHRTIFPASCSSSYNITTANSSVFNNASVLFYTPCTLTMSNLNAFSGQALANVVTVSNSFTMNAVPVLVPGIGGVNGFQQSIVYVREVAD